jgi:hypothetical protein
LEVLGLSVKASWTLAPWGRSLAGEAADFKADRNFFGVGEEAVSCGEVVGGNLSSIHDLLIANAREAVWVKPLAKARSGFVR